MTIDTNELRRLAQAATPGPWYVTGKLTRYVEARIDGGLIQEVAACGPTKADGGYGPQQEANARLLAAANPATISELLDRLEAAERDVALKEKVIDALGSELNAVANERDALRADKATLQQMTYSLKDRLEAAEKERDNVAQQLVQSEQGKRKISEECDALRAKIAEMERQEPVAFALYSGWAFKAAYHKEHEACDQRDRRQLSADLGGSLEAYRVVPLYALPGARGEEK